VPIGQFREKFLTADGQLNTAVNAHRVVIYKQAVLDVLNERRARGQLQWHVGQMVSPLLGSSVESPAPKRNTAPSTRTKTGGWDVSGLTPDVWLVLKCCHSRLKTCECPAMVRVGFFWADVWGPDKLPRKRGDDVPLVIEAYAPKKKQPQGCVHLQDVYAPSAGVRGSGATVRDEAAAQRLSGFERRTTGVADKSGTRLDACVAARSCAQLRAARACKHGWTRG